MTTKKDFVSTMIRLFSDSVFKKGVLYFRHDGTLFPVVRVDSDGIYYGSAPHRMTPRELCYRIEKIHMNRSILDKKVVVDISYIRQWPR